MSCQVCHAKHVDLKLCGRCFIPLYCSKECQVSDWKTGHREVCKPTKPSNFAFQAQEVDAKEVTDFMKHLEAHLDKVEQFPSATSFQELQEKLEKRNRDLDAMLAETRGMSFRVLASQGAKAGQIDFIAKEMEKFEAKLRPVIQASLQGGEMAVTVFDDMQTHLTNAQTTIHAISGWTPPKDKSEEQVWEEQVIQMATCAGSMLARYGLDQEVRVSIPAYRKGGKEGTLVTDLNIVESGISIPHPIGSSLGDLFGAKIWPWIQHQPSYVVGRAYNFFATIMRDFVYCWGSTPDMTYSKLRRMQDGQAREREHDRALAYVKRHDYLGRTILKAATLLEEAADMMENYSLNLDPEKEEEWESKRQTASLLFSIALGTGFGVYTALSWTDPETLRLDKLKNVTLRNETLQQDRQELQILQETHDAWEKDVETYQKLKDESIEMERTISQRSSIFGNVARNDISFKQALEAGIEARTGCSFTITSTIPVLDSSSAQALQVKDTGLTAHARNFVSKLREIDMSQKPAHLDPAVYNRNTGTGIANTELDCDPALVMDAFKNIGDALFAHTESMLRQAPKQPDIPQNIHDKEMQRALDFTHEQLQTWRKPFTTIPTNAEWAGNNPKAMAQLLVTLNKANPNLGNALIASIQDSIRKTSEEQTAASKEYEIMQDMATLLMSDTQSKITTKTMSLRVGEEWVAKETDKWDKRHGKIAQDPVTFAIGTLTYIITRAFSLGTFGQQQFQGSYLSSLSVAYASLSQAVKDIDKATWVKLITTLTEFLTKAIAFIWWLNVGLFELLWRVVAFAAILGAFAFILDRAWQVLFGGAVRWVAKKCNYSGFVRDEGSAMHSAVMQWLFGIGKAPVTFVVSSAFKTLMFVSGGLGLFSLSLLVLSSCTLALGNILVSGPSIFALIGATINSAPQLITTAVFVLPVILSKFGKWDEHTWFCLRRLLMASWALTSLTGWSGKPWTISISKPNITIPFTDFDPSTPWEYNLGTPTWESYVFAVFATYQMGSWLFKRKKPKKSRDERNPPREEDDIPNVLLRTDRFTWNK